MNKQISKPSLRERIRGYLKLLCGGLKQQSKEAQVDVPTKYTPTVKKRRLTFALDRALIKLSRRNVLIEQFSSPKQISLHLEKYIAQRLSFANIAVFQGNFTQISMSKVYYPIKLLGEQPSVYEYTSKSNKIVTNTVFPLRKIYKGVDAFVIEVRASILQKIEQTLSEYHKYVQNFIFLCENDFEIESVRQLFALYKQEFMFQVQRIMMLDKCVKNIVYISRCGEVLDIDRGSLIEYYIEELSKKDSFIDKYHFSCLLDALFQDNLYVEVASVIGQLMTSTDQIEKYDREFSVRIMEKYPVSIAIVKRQERWREKQDDQPSNIPKFYENTPLFGANQKTTTKARISDAGSVISRRNAVTTHSFARAISRRMGDWQD